MLVSGKVREEGQALFSSFIEFEYKEAQERDKAKQGPLWCTGLGASQCAGRTSDRARASMRLWQKAPHVVAVHNNCLSRHHGCAEATSQMMMQGSADDKALSAAISRGSRGRYRIQQISR